LVGPRQRQSKLQGKEIGGGGGVEGEEVGHTEGALRQKCREGETRKKTRKVESVIQAGGPKAAR